VGGEPVTQPGKELTGVDNDFESARKEDQDIGSPSAGFTGLKGFKNLSVFAPVSNMMQESQGSGAFG
jgi:hypothetical protein